MKSSSRMANSALTTSGPGSSTTPAGATRAAARRPEPTPRSEGWRIGAPLGPADGVDCPPRTSCSGVGDAGAVALELAVAVAVAVALADGELAADEVAVAADVPDAAADRVAVGVGRTVARDVGVGVGRGVGVAEGVGVGVAVRTADRTVYVG